MRILVAEDEILLQEYLKEGLIHQGFAVDVVDNGIDAEHMGQEESYDAIVLDLGLPKRPGLDVLINWRKFSIQTPVIILTAKGDIQDRVKGLNLGADDYLGKPFHVEELVARLNGLIRREFGQIGGPLRVGGLELNEDTQSVTTQDGKVCKLTSIEFRMFRYFMLRPGHILSRNELTAHVYNFDSDIESNVIEVYINRLRHKLGEKHITTRRGQGYIFEPDD